MKSKYEIDNNGGNKKDLWVLGGIMLIAICGLVYVLSQFA